MPDTTDPAAATLAKARRIANGLQCACRIPDRKPDFSGCGGPAAHAYWEYFTPAKVAGILEGLEAALKEHQPVDRGEDLEPICRSCHRGFWPCPTYLAITAELTKGAAHG
jgi:hypothetical protein